MKKLLSVAAILLLVAALVPAQGFAGLRGAFDPLTNSNGLSKGNEQPAWRGASAELWFAMSTKSAELGQEAIRSIWQHWNQSQAIFFVDDPLDARRPLLLDPTGATSYADPAWSPNGIYLAYVKADPGVTYADIYVQQYLFAGDPTIDATTVGPPILVAGGDGSLNRHPYWDPTGTKLTFDRTEGGDQADVMMITVFPAVGGMTNLTGPNLKSEVTPAWSPNGAKIVYSTNKFGPFVLEILDLGTMTTSLAETNYASVRHSNPDWSSDGASIYYDAQEGESPDAGLNIWKLDLASQAKCEISVGVGSDFDVAVSRRTRFTPDGVPYNFLLISTTGGTLGSFPAVWRTNYVQQCRTPLPMNVSISPSTLNLNSQGDKFTATFTFPAETKAAGYVCRSVNAGGEGIRMRRSLIVSPTIEGVLPKFDPAVGSFFPLLHEYTAGGEPTIDIEWSRRAIVARMVRLGLVDKEVPLRVDAYSNNVGRAFRGFAYVRVASSNLAGSAVMFESASPNPFNPRTKLSFATSKAGNVTLRIFNVRGELVRTLVNGHMESGSHTANWDGRTDHGRSVGSGVYYAKLTGANGAVDRMKMVLVE